MKFLISNDDAVHASALQAFAFDTEQMYQWATYFNLSQC